MSERSPNEGHAQVAGAIEDAADTLPEHAVNISESPLETVTVNSDSGFAQLSEWEGSSNAVAHIRTEESAPEQTTAGTYGFASSEDEGVSHAAVRRKLQPGDGTSRAGSVHNESNLHERSTYEHEFSAQDKAAKLITDLAIKQAARSEVRDEEGHLTPA